MLPQALWNESTASHRSFSGNDTVDSSQLSPFGPEVDEAIKQHAVAAFPKECCGIVVDGVYMPCENVAKRPHSEFAISEETLQIFANRIQAVVHSHPKVMPYPSKVDMEQQELWDIPWAIASVTHDGHNPPHCMDLFWFGDALPILPLIGRAFRPGVQDCYAVVRDWHRLRGTDCAQIMRDHAWWLDDRATNYKKIDLFGENLPNSGWRLISAGELRVGDAFAAPYNTEVPCHCGVLIEGDKVLHHMSDRKSEITEAFPWIRRSVEGGRFYRHESME